MSLKWNEQILIEEGWLCFWNSKAGDILRNTKSQLLHYWGQDFTTKYEQRNNKYVNTVIIDQSKCMLLLFCLEICSVLTANQIQCLRVHLDKK